MKAYQCSKCERLDDMEDYCTCRILGDIRPRHREKGSAKICKENFELLPLEQRWHEKFNWED